MWDQLIVDTFEYERKRKGLERIEDPARANLLVAYHAARSHVRNVCGEPMQGMTPGPRGRSR
jgi:hypothetical protein